MLVALRLDWAGSSRRTRARAKVWVAQVEKSLDNCCPVDAGSRTMRAAARPAGAKAAQKQMSDDDLHAGTPGPSFIIWSLRRQVTGNRRRDGPKATILVRLAAAPPFISGRRRDLHPGRR